MINQHKEKKKNNNKRIFKRNFQIVVLICTLLIMLFSYNHCSLKLSDGQVTVAVISDNDEETVIDLILPIESDENVEDVDLVNESSSIISKAKFPLTDNEWRLLGKRVKMPEQGDMYAEVLNPKTIAITIVPIWDDYNNVLDRDLLDPEEVENESNFIISSSDDDNFSLGVGPSLSGLHRKPIFAPYQFEDFRMSERIFLKLEVPLKSEVDYTVKVLSNILGSEIDIEFSYTNSQFSHAIHVNEQGYITSKSKKAFMGMSLGTAGELDIENLSFSIIDLDSREVVYEGLGELQASEWSEAQVALLPYQQVYELNFSEFITNGKYIIHNEGLGYSAPFEINEDAFRQGLLTFMSGMYHQRSGVALTLPYTRFTRGVGHPNDGEVLDHTSLEEDGYEVQFTSDLEGEQIDATMGHYDAGDYGKYTYQGARVIWDLLTALDNNPAELAHDNLGIPESGNGIPDIMDELIHEIKWVKNMQDPNDGGVFIMVKPEGGFQVGSLPDEYVKRYIWPKGTSTTGGFAYAMARAARSKELKKYAPELIEELKSKAILAWGFLEANPDPEYVSTEKNMWHYGGDSRDKRSLAALELYALTGEEKYYNSFLEMHIPNYKYWNWVELTGGYGKAVVSILFWPDDGPNIEDSVKTTAINEFKSSVDSWIDDINLVPYNIAIDHQLKRWHNPGWWFPASYSLNFFYAWKYYNEDKYLDAMIDQVNYQFGTNPLNKTFVTGLGFTRVFEIIDQDTHADLILPPVHGLPMGIGSLSWRGYSHDYDSYIKNDYYPEVDSRPWGAVPYTGMYELFIESCNIRNEFTIEHLTRMTIAQALLTPVIDSENNFPEIEISILNNPEVDNSIQTSINFIKNPPLEYSIIWRVYKIGDHLYESYFSSTLNVEKEIGNPIYKIEAEIIDNNGLRAWADTSFNTRNYENTNIPLEPFELTDHTVALYHFDNNLDDASSNQLLEPRITEGVKIDEENVLWSLSKEGTTLHFTKEDDSLEVELQKGQFEESEVGTISEISFEWLMFIDNNSSYPVLRISKKTYNDNSGYKGVIYSGTGNENFLSFPVLSSESTIFNPYKNMWNYFKIVINSESAALYMNNEEIFKVNDSSALSYYVDNNSAPTWFSIGEFVGYIDELRIQVKSETPKTTSEIQEIEFPGIICNGAEDLASYNEEYFTLTYGNAVGIVMNEDEIDGCYIERTELKELMYSDGVNYLKVSFQYKVGSDLLKFVSSNFGWAFGSIDEDTVIIHTNNIGYSPQAFTEEIDVQTADQYIDVEISLIQNDIYLKIIDDNGEKDIISFLDNNRLNSSGYYKLYGQYGDGFYFKNLRIYRDPDL